MFRRLRTSATLPRLLAAFYGVAMGLVLDLHHPGCPASGSEPHASAVATDSVRPGHEPGSHDESCQICLFAAQAQVSPTLPVVSVPHIQPVARVTVRSDHQTTSASITAQSRGPPSSPLS